MLITKRSAASAEHMAVARPSIVIPSEQKALIAKQALLCGNAQAVSKWQAITIVFTQMCTLSS